MKKDIIRMIIGGAGGQGVLTLGKLFAISGMKKDLEVLCLPAYGAEMRGGYVYCTVILSKNKEIFSPVISKCDFAIFMNENSYRLLSHFLKEDSYLFVNSSLIKIDKKNNIFQLPATHIAEEIGDIRVANMVMAGATFFLLKKFFFPFTVSDLFYGIKNLMHDKKSQEISKKGVIEGWEEMKKKWTEISRK